MVGGNDPDDDYHVNYNEDYNDINVELNHDGIDDHEFNNNHAHDHDSYYDEQDYH